MRKWKKTILGVACIVFLLLAGSCCYLYHLTYQGWVIAYYDHDVRIYGDNGWLFFPDRYNRVAVGPCDAFSIHEKNAPIPPDNPLTIEVGGDALSITDLTPKHFESWGGSCSEYQDGQGCHCHPGKPDAHAHIGAIFRDGRIICFWAGQFEARDDRTFTLSWQGENQQATLPMKQRELEAALGTPKSIDVPYLD